jgi:hypothetical protein
VSVSTHEGIDGHYVSYLIPAKAVEHAAEVAKTLLVGRDRVDSSEMRVKGLEMALRCLI